MSVALTIRQVAERLGSEYTSTYQLKDRKRDPLPAYRLGELRGYRVDSDDLEAWIQRQKGRVS